MRTLIAAECAVSEVDGPQPSVTGPEEDIYGIIGIINLVSGRHLIVIKSCSPVGTIEGEPIWRVTKHAYAHSAHSTIRTAPPGCSSMIDSAGVRLNVSEVPPDSSISLCLTYWPFLTNVSLLSPLPPHSPSHQKIS